MILDPRDPDDILVYMKRSLAVGEGRRAVVYRGDRLVGKLRLYRIAGGYHRGKTVPPAPAKDSFRPTDRILLEPKP